MNRKKIFYRYNPQTLSYDRVFPSLQSRILIVLRHLLSGILIGFGGLFLFLYIFDSPQEKVLKQENKLMQMQYDILSRRVDHAFRILEPIQERDDYMYRAIYQAEPIAQSIRASGVGGFGRYEELQNLSSPELIVQTVQKMDVLDKQLYIQSNSLDEVLQMIRTQKDRIHHMPSIMPVADKFLRRMASGYGMRKDPVYGTQRMHQGMDFTAPTGTPVYATADGIVLNVETNSWGYGKCIDLDHGYNITTKYAHLDEFLVKQGQKVSRGDIIGKVGNTGKSTGPHLHYEVRLRGNPQNPRGYYHGDLTPAEFDEMLEASANRGQVMD